MVKIDTVIGKIDTATRCSGLSLPAFPTTTAGYNTSTAIRNINTGDSVRIDMINIDSAVYQ